MTPKYEQFETQPPALSDGAYLYEKHATIWTPFVRALITGVLVAIPTMYALNHYEVADWLFYGVMSGFVVALIVWWLGMQLWERQWAKIISLAEHVTNVDINQDGQIGTETNHRVNVDLRTVDNSQDITTRASFDVDDDRMATFCEAVLSGRSMSLPEWTGAGNLFSRREYEAMISEMLERGIIRQRNPKSPAQGYVMTRAGQAAMKVLAGHSPTPSNGFAR